MGTLDGFRLLWTLAYATGIAHGLIDTTTSISSLVFDTPPLRLELEVVVMKRISKALVDNRPDRCWL
jgi:hypothetical protein